MRHLNGKFCADCRFEMIDARFQILFVSALNGFEEPGKESYIVNHDELMTLNQFIVKTYLTLNVVHGLKRRKKMSVQTGASRVETENAGKGREILIVRG